MSEPVEIICDHVRTGELPRHARVTLEKIGGVFILCQPCFTNATQSGKFNPLEPIGFHAYRSTDPTLPKDRWERRTKTPMHGTQYREKAENMEPDKPYYFYFTSVNSYGVESSPSEVIGFESLDDYILGTDLISEEEQ